MSFLQSDQIYESQITMARELRGLTQGDLADKLTIKRPQLCKIENGVHRCSVDLINEIAEVLDLPISFFYQEMGHHGLPMCVLYKCNM